MIPTGGLMRADSESQHCLTDPSSSAELTSAGTVSPAPAGIRHIRDHARCRGCTAATWSLGRQAQDRRGSEAAGQDTVLRLCVVVIGSRPQLRQRAPLLARHGSGVSQQQGRYSQHHIDVIPNLAGGRAQDTRAGPTAEWTMVSCALHARGCKPACIHPSLVLRSRFGSTHARSRPVSTAPRLRCHARARRGPQPPSDDDA
jgi:hypothetical protein